MSMNTNAKQSDARVKRGASQQQQNLTVIAMVVAVAVVAVGIFIFLNQSNALGGSKLDYTGVVVGRSGDDSSSLIGGSGASATGVVMERTNDGGYIIGDPNAPVTLVEFADFLCPHCQAYYPTVEQFIEEFVLTGQARFEFRMLPTQNRSPFVMQVAECAADQYDGGFFPIHDEIFGITRASGNIDNIARSVADEFDLSLDALLRCTTDVDQYVTDQRLAQSVGVTGTPGIRIRYGDGPMQQIPGVTSGAPEFDVLAGIVLSASLSQQ